MFESSVTSGHDPAPSRRSLSSQRTPAGENRIRTVGPAEKETAVERGPAADHRRLARRPVLNDLCLPIMPSERSTDGDRRAK